MLAFLPVCFDSPACHPCSPLVRSNAIAAACGGGPEPSPAGGSSPSPAPASPNPSPSGGDDSPDEEDASPSPAPSSPAPGIGDLGLGIGSFSTGPLPDGKIKVTAMLDDPAICATYNQELAKWVLDLASRHGATGSAMPPADAVKVRAPPPDRLLVLSQSGLALLSCWPAVALPLHCSALCAFAGEARKLTLVCHAHGWRVVARYPAQTAARHHILPAAPTIAPAD